MRAQRRSVIRTATVATGALAVLLLPAGAAFAADSTAPSESRTSIMLPDNGLAGLAEKAKPAAQGRAHRWRECTGRGRYGHRRPPSTPRKPRPAGLSRTTGSEPVRQASTCTPGLNPYAGPTPDTRTEAKHPNRSRVRGWSPGTLMEPGPGPSPAARAERGLNPDRARTPAVRRKGTDGRTASSAPKRPPASLPSAPTPPPPPTAVPPHSPGSRRPPRPPPSAVGPYGWHLRP